MPKRFTKGGRTLCRARPPAPGWAIRLAALRAWRGRGEAAFNGVRTSCSATALRRRCSACVAASTRSRARSCQLRPPGSTARQYGYGNFMDLLPPLNRRWDTAPGQLVRTLCSQAQRAPHRAQARDTARRRHAILQHARPVFGQAWAK